MILKKQHYFYPLPHFKFVKTHETFPSFLLYNLFLDMLFDLFLHHRRRRFCFQDTIYYLFLISTVESIVVIYANKEGIQRGTDQ